MAIKDFLSTTPNILHRRMEYLGVIEIFVSVMMHDMDISQRVNSASELSELRQNDNSEMTRT